MDGLSKHKDRHVFSPSQPAGGERKRSHNVVVGAVADIDRKARQQERAALESKIEKKQETICDLETEGNKRERKNDRDNLLKK